MLPTPTGPTWTYFCFGFAVRASFPIDELSPLDGEAGDEAVEIREGEVPEALPGALSGPLGLQVSGETALFSAAGAARYLITAGRSVVVQREPDGSELNMRLFLLGSVLGIVCHQRGLLPLHANALVTADGAVAFAGHSGAGKSTLAAHFARAGYTVLSDDLCVLSFGTGRPLAWPGLPRLKLWGDAADAFGHDRKTLDKAIDGRDKYFVRADAGPTHEPVPFRRLYLLSQAGEGAPAGIRRLRGGEAMQALLANTYRAAWLDALGLRARHFALCATVLQHAEVFSAVRTWGFDVFEREARQLEQHFSPASEPAGQT